MPLSYDSCSKPDDTIKKQLFQLYEIAWYRVKIRLQNTRNIFARQHPLSIFNAVFISTAQKSPVDKNEFFFHPLRQLEPRIHKNKIYDLELIFPRTGIDRIHIFLDALENHLKEPKNNFKLISCGQPEQRTLALIEQEWGNDTDNLTEICLNFITPFPFPPKNRKRKWLVDRDVFFKQLSNRIRRFYDIEIQHTAVKDIRLLPYYWKYPKPIKHKSASNNNKQFINGTVGLLFLRGPVSRILPLLLVCSELHAGRRGANGQGFYQLEKKRSFFDPMLKDLDLFQGFISRLDQESDLADEIAQTFIDKPAALSELHEKMVRCSVEQKPANGFYIEKRRRGKRLIATLELQDYLVHKFLAYILTPVVDRMFEDASVGFRTGRSRDTARKMIRKACSEGYTYVLESDIAAFFDNIDWGILEKKLKESLPQQDRLTLALVNQAVKIPLRIEGKDIQRTRGLVQGSPLSPLLSNLYLDSFDEEMERRGFRLIRYGDDFLVMTRSRDEAEEALAAIREILTDLKLLIKEEKTDTKPVDLGFSFLGISFDAGMDEDYVADAALGKTLYIRHQYAFAGLDGDSLIVRKNRQLQARLPLKRISEIVVLGTNTVSSRLLGRCAQDRIPVSFCSPMGYYYSTLRPDSKRHLHLAADHAAAFHKLDDKEKTEIAAKIVTAKIHNYICWFRERCPNESRNIRKRMEITIATIAKTESINKIRGFEGEAARLMFGFINHMCEDSEFHCKSRNKRARRDMYNSLLDFAYSLLFTRLNVLLRGRGLNPYLGILHSHKDNYESLVCDLQEPFRCRIDRFLIKTINRKIIRPSDFEKNDYGKLWLVSKAVGKFIQAFEREMDVRLAGDSGTLKQLLIAQVRSVLDWVEQGQGLIFYQSGIDNQDIWITGT